MCHSWWMYTYGQMLLKVFMALIVYYCVRRAGRVHRGVVRQRDAGAVDRRHGRGGHGQRVCRDHPYAERVSCGRRCFAAGVWVGGPTIDRTPPVYVFCVQFSTTSHPFHVPGVQFRPLCRQRTRYPQTHVSFLLNDPGFASFCSPGVPSGHSTHPGRQAHQRVEGTGEA